MENRIVLRVMDPQPDDTVVITEVMTRKEAERRYGPVVVAGPWPWEARDEE